MATTLDYVKAQLPDYADTYVKDMLSRTQAYTDVNANPYQQYTGERVADFTPLQQQAFEGAQALGPSAYTAQGAGIASLAANQALNAGAGFQPGQFQNQYQSQGPYQASEFTNQFNASAGQYNPNQITSERFGQPQAQEYMSPYMQSVVDIQQREAQRQADIAGTQRNAQATGAGAFGGSRQAIMDAEAARNLAIQKGDIQAQGLQSAFQQAQAQFNADQARGLTAQQATEQSRQYGAGLGLQGAGLGAQYGLAAQQGNAAQQQFAYQQALQNAQNQAMYGAQAAQLGEQSRQYGAGLGLQGASTALQGASTLGNLGGQEFNQAKDVTGLQFMYGGAQQANQQALNDVNYQNFLAAQNYPREMLSFQSNMLNGLPMGGTTTRTSQTPEPSMLGQLAGVGMLAKGFGLFKKGGAVKSKPAGLPGMLAHMRSKA